MGPFSRRRQGGKAAELLFLGRAPTSRWRFKTARGKFTHSNNAFIKTHSFNAGKGTAFPST